MDRLSSAIEEYIDFPKIFESRIELEFVLLNLSRGRGEVYSKRDCADWRELRTHRRAPATRSRCSSRRCSSAATGSSTAASPGTSRSSTRSALGATEIYLLAPIASQLPYQGRFRTLLDFVQRFVDVMWRTIGNMGYLYARMENGRLHDVPVTVIEPGEQYSGFGPLHVFNAYPRKNRAPHGGRLPRRQARDGGAEDAWSSRLPRRAAVPTALGAERAARKRAVGLAAAAEREGRRDPSASIRPFRRPGRFRTGHPRSTAGTQSLQ